MVILMRRHEFLDALGVVLLILILAAILAAFIASGDFNGQSEWERF